MLVLDMLFVVSAVLFDMLKARQLACVSKNGQKCPAALSLSSWRAWIEIQLKPEDKKSLQSLSSWRAWIEITATRQHQRTRPWSLSSWRAWIEMNSRCRHASNAIGRSPHGERGLKCMTVARFSITPKVALLMESVD